MEKKLIQELEKIKNTYSNYYTNYSNPRDGMSGFPLGVCSGWAEASSFFVGDISKLLKKLKSKEAIEALYNGILNDYSIQRYSLGWKDVKECIEKLYKNLNRNENVQFENGLLEEALIAIEYKNSPLHKKLKKVIVSFGKELEINLESLKK